MSKKSRNQSNRKAGFAYYVREGLSSVFVHGFTSLAAMLVIAACLMITGTFALVAYNLDLQIRELEGQSEIVVYIDENVSRDDALALGQKIRALDDVKAAEFVTKEQLFEDYLDSLGEDAYVMEELRDDNPLRDSYQITMDDVSLHADTVKALENINGVAASSSMQEVSERLIQIRQVVNLISYTMVGHRFVFASSSSCGMCCWCCARCHYPVLGAHRWCECRDCTQWGTPQAWYHIHGKCQ